MCPREAVLAVSLPWVTIRSTPTPLSLCINLWSLQPSSIFATAIIVRKVLIYPDMKANISSSIPIKAEINPTQLCSTRGLVPCQMTKYYWAVMAGCKNRIWSLFCDPEIVEDWWSKVSSYQEGFIVMIVWTAPVWLIRYYLSDTLSIIRSQLTNNAPEHSD